MNNLENKINIINRYFKKTELILDITFLEYETYNIYIRLDYYKKLNCCKLSWFDLNIVNNKNIEKYISSEYISIDIANYICNLFEKTDKVNYIAKNDKHKIIINCHADRDYHYELSRYIPKSLPHLSEIFIIIFNNLPKKLDNFLYESHAEITNTKTQYEYNDEFNFDLFNDNLENIFYKNIIERGSEYYNSNKVKFLEKIDNKYYSVVEGTHKYLIVIKYDNINKLTQVYCTCPCKFYCKHIYSVILAIRNKEEKKFYKVIYKNNQENLLESVLESKYFLCSGVEDEYLEIINRYGEIELVPMLDNDNNLNWKVIEDTKEKYLTQKIEKCIKKHKKNQ